MLLERLWRWRRALTVTSIGALAAVLRFTGLAYPNKLIFDETYYAKGAYSLLKLGYEGDWASDANDKFIVGDFSSLSTTPDYVVHPPLGKWMIAGGMEIFGPNSFGWRFSSALIGTVTVMMLVLVGARLFRSLLWGAAAGVFLAIDGVHVVLSRAALLDVFLTFWVLLAFWFLLIDRDRARRKLRDACARERERLGLAADAELPGWGPRIGVRWWRLGAMVAFGLSAGVKWSGLWFAAFLLILSVAWDLRARRAEKIANWRVGSLVRAVAPAFVAALLIIPTAYLATWSAWFASDVGYKRHWAEDHPGEGVTVLPDALTSLVDYHREMLAFHEQLTPDNGYSHQYVSKPDEWLLQQRPTSFFWRTVDPPQTDPTPEEKCGWSRCASAITSLGNPVLWWASAVALAFAAFRILMRRDWVGLAVVSGTLAGVLPWFLTYDRIVFQFYSVSFAPWVMLTLAWGMWRIVLPDGNGGRISRAGAIAATCVAAGAFVAAALFWPLWSGEWVQRPYWTWLTGISLWLPGFNWI